MTTYVYETIPQKAGQKPRHYEIKQSMKDAPLTEHPETGEPIRRVMSGGIGLMSGSKSESRSSSSGGSCCGPSCGCH